MNLKDFYAGFNLDESIAESTGFNPYYLRMSSGLKGKISAGGRRLIDLASNNYLGLADDERVKRAAIQGVHDYGTSLCGTPIATGYLDLYAGLEEKLSAFVGLEKTILFPSCYQANNGLFACLAGPRDLILVDRLVHSSLFQGIKAAGCKIRPFQHNDLDHLERGLQRGGGCRQIFVVTESVFSTEGRIAPLREIIGLCEKYQALPVIDDSHGLGVLGQSGQGILEEQGITEFRGIYTASLGKALANSGGMVSGNKKLIAYLKYYCSHLVYSTALTPPALAGIGAVLEIIAAEFEGLKKTMVSYQNQIYRGLVEAGFQVEESKAPINAIHTGSKENTFALAKALYERGILATPFIEPSVPFNEGRVRLIAGANLSRDSIDEVLEIIRQVSSL